MEKKKGKIQLTLLEAVDQLSSLAECDELFLTEGSAKEEPSAEIAQEASVQTPLDSRIGGISWLRGKSLEEAGQALRQTFYRIHLYFKELSKAKKERLSDAETQKGLRAVMQLAGEAIEKMDLFETVFSPLLNGEKAKNLKEYKDLKHYYKHRIAAELSATLEEEKEFEVFIKRAGPEDAADVHRRGINDLEVVRRDRDYELFYIESEEGKPFFNKSVVRHVRMLAQFDQIELPEDELDPFVKMGLIYDKELFLAAKEFLNKWLPQIDFFYQEARQGFRHEARHEPHQERHSWLTSLQKAIQALLLSANPRNLATSTHGKSSKLYFQDFQLYLREALSHPSYEAALKKQKHAPETFIGTALHLLHGLCASLYTRSIDWQSCLSFLYRICEKKVTKPKAFEKDDLFIWHFLIDQDDNLRKYLKEFPNGPLLKTMESIQNEQILIGFDPISHGNLPSELYSFYVEEHTPISCLRLASPTFQDIVYEASVIAEFGGFLRSLDEEGAYVKHLLINIQDRTSWRGHARSVCLENYAAQKEHQEHLVVLTFPKETSFYFQKDDYLHLDDVEDFKQIFIDQIEGEEESGFSFSSVWQKKEIMTFAKKALLFLHQNLYENKKTLDRRERLDMIELFYFLFTLKNIEKIKPTSFSFTCKDALDRGVADSAGFYAFLHILQQKMSWGADQRGHFFWMLYHAVFLIRERAIDERVFSRMVSALSFFHQEMISNSSSILKELPKLFSSHFLKSISLN